jgi:hypothetical protein
MTNIEDFKTIYDSLDNSVSEIIKNLESKSNDKDFEIVKLQVLNIIKVFREEKLNKAIDELKENQEWDKFTVAFYGETNAGKSTIIESLRIYFKEKEKFEQQMRFKAVLEEYEQNINELENKIYNNKNEISDFEKKNETLINTFKMEKEELESNLNELIIKDNQKKESSIIYKILSLLFFININKKINETKRILKEKEEISKEEIKRTEIILNIKKKEILEIEEKMTNLKSSSFTLLHSLRDGQIIGDGRSDFTQKSKEYNFTYNNQEFTFLDVPGIEGHETIVIDEISSAVKKAHAVFYVTIEEPQEGTLKKIKEHLGSQTEVYTISNKRINSLRQLDKSLINDDKKESLKIVDEKLIEILGENYAGHKIVSAKVAFLALANCLLKESVIFNEQCKFLDIYSVNELLEKSLFNNFCQFITDEMVVNTKQKIKKSNYNKANELLRELIIILSKASKENFEPFYKGLSNEVELVKSNLNDTLKKMEIHLKSVIESALIDFETNIRKEIHAHIERNISDDSFKNKFELLVKENLEKMQITIPLDIEKQIFQFQDSIIEVLRTFERRINNVIQDYQTFKFDNLDSKFNINLNINNGVNGWAVASGFLAAGGTAYTYWTIAAANSWNWVGWTMIAAGILSSLIAFGKGIRKWFSNSYKRSEQKEAAAENLKKITENLKPKITENIKSISNDASVRINKIIDDLEILVNQSKQAIEYTKESYENLIKISQDITLKGNK